MRLKVELHCHGAEDPEDWIPYSTPGLIDRAAALGYAALAITLHQTQIDLEPFRAHACARNVLLIPGVERTIEGKHVLLLNFTAASESVSTFADLKRLRADEPGLVIAPHPFFPLGSALGRHLEQYADLFDAVEISSMYARGLDFNQRAIRWARAHDKPLVGNGDIHRLAQLGATFTIVDAEPTPDAICEAVRAGRVEVHTRSLGWVRTVGVFGAMVGTKAWQTLTDYVRSGTIETP